MHRLLIGIVVSGAFAGLSASTQSNPLYCGDEAPCPTGQSCSIQHVCQAGFTLDEGVFHFDGSKYWVATSTPTFSGSSDAPNATIHVMVGEQQFGPAEFAGESWKLTLPPNIIKDSEDANIRFLQSVGNKQVEIARLVALDDKAPTAKIEATQILDESKDVVTFDEDGTPVHDHQAYPVVINDVQEAVVNKYAHLLHVGHAHAKELAPNPLLIKVAIKAKVALSENGANFRIVDAGGAVVADWQNGQVTKVDGGFVAAAEITRANVPNLKLSGRYCLQWNVSDWAHRSAEAQTCMKLTLLAPPLHAVGPRLPTAAPESIGNWKLATGAPFNTMTGDPKAQIYEGVFTNNTPEPVRVEIKYNTDLELQLTRSAKTVDTLLSDGPANYTCFGYCDSTETQTPVTNQAVVLRRNIFFRAFDEENRPATQCIGTGSDGIECQLPAATERPSRVRIVAVAGYVPRGPIEADDYGIFPLIRKTHSAEANGIVDERIVNNQAFYGKELTLTGCAPGQQRNDGGDAFICSRTQTIKRLQMLSAVKAIVYRKVWNETFQREEHWVPGFQWKSAVPGNNVAAPPTGSNLGNYKPLIGVQGLQWDGGTLP